MHSFPAGLGAAGVEGYSMTERFNELRTNYNGGDVGVKRLSTGSIKEFAINMTLTRTETDTLMEFFHDTVKQSQIPFTMTLYTQPQPSTLTVRFVSGINVRPSGEGSYANNVSFTVLEAVASV